MPQIKVSPSLPLALAMTSLIAFGGPIAAAATTASDAQSKKHAAAPAKKHPATAKKGTTKSAALQTVPAKTATVKPASAHKATAPKAVAHKATGHKAGAKKVAAGKGAKTASAAKSGKGLPLPRPRPDSAGGERAPALVLASADSQPIIVRQSVAAPITTITSSADVAAVKQALDLIRKGKISAASEVKQTISDPAALKLIDWFYLRSSHSEAGFDRYAAFARANPSWPSVGMLQKRAEGALWDDKRDAAMVRAYFASAEPRSGKGRLAFARALLAQGDQAGAQRYVREAWRRDVFAAEIEQQTLDAFGSLLTTADHRARMHRLLYAQDEGGTMRAARRLGPADMAVAKARLALAEKSDKAGALLDAVPAEARNDPNYVMGRIQWLRRNDKIAEAGQLMLSMPNDPDVLHDVDEWWVERRLLARKLLDIGDPHSAYRVARDAAPPEKENNRVEHEFTAGWIALRFLNDPRTALTHFARIPETTSHPTSLARAYYWQGRALEAMSRHHEARAQYQAAARSSAAYYGQIARARLGMGEMAVQRPPDFTAAERAALRNVDIVRAVEILYALNERDLVTTMSADLGDRPIDIGALVMIGELAAKNHDARSMLYLGKTAIARGHPMDHFAFPDVGIPSYAAIGPEIDRSIVFAITRQESAFNPKIVSSANALGLMQVTPEAGRDTAKRFGAKFDQKRLLHDSVYNVQMGSAELAGLLQDYRGSYILTFAGYNAGRGRIREWVQRYGDPRDPQVDPIDWVERIPFSETRNYVQRVMENTQVYRVRLGGPTRLMIEADLRRGASAN